jgi:Rrf2 family transcriptional regulator, nitric oxide-sensitive transcriptional repressor
MKLKHSTEVALRILSMLNTNKLTHLSHLSHKLQIPRDNMMRPLRFLTQAGLITSFRGRNGGIKLARPPNGISLGDVVLILERHGSSTSVQYLDRLLDEANAAFGASLNRYTMASLVRFGGIDLFATRELGAESGDRDRRRG